MQFFKAKTKSRCRKQRKYKALLGSANKMGTTNFLLGALVLAICFNDCLSQATNFISNAKTCGDCNSTTSASCSQQQGWVMCFCKSGYAGDGLNCTKLVYCDQSCCPPGYNWDTTKKGCMDIDECQTPATHTCLTKPQCLNRNGIYICNPPPNPTCSDKACDAGLDCVRSGNGPDVTCVDPCVKAVEIDGSQRLYTINSVGRFPTDRYLYGWYRYANNLRLREGYVGALKCGSTQPYTLSSHPTLSEGVKSVPLLFNGLNSKSIGPSILVKACPDGHYVYKFAGLMTYEVYCTEVTPPTTTTTTATTITTTTTTPTTITTTTPTTTTPTTTPTTITTTTPTTTTPTTTPQTTTTASTTTEVTTTPTTTQTTPTPTTTPQTTTTTTPTPTTTPQTTTTPTTASTTTEVTTPTTTTPTTIQTTPTDTTTPQTTTTPTDTTTPQTTTPTDTTTPQTTTTPTDTTTASSTTIETTPTPSTTPTVATTTPEPTTATATTEPVTTETTPFFTTTEETTAEPATTNTLSSTSASATTTPEPTKTTPCKNITTQAPVIPTTTHIIEENITVTAVQSKSKLSVRILTQIINNKEVKSLEINETTTVHIDMRTISSSQIFIKTTKSISPTSILVLVGSDGPHTLSNATDTVVTTTESTIPNTSSPSTYCSKPAETSTITETSAIAGNTCSKVTSASTTTTITTTEEVIVLGPDGFAKSCTYL